MKFREPQLQLITTVARRDRPGAASDSFPPVARDTLTARCADFSPRGHRYSPAQNCSSPVRPAVPGRRPRREYGYRPLPGGERADSSDPPGRRPFRRSPSREQDPYPPVGDSISSGRSTVVGERACRASTTDPYRSTSCMARSTPPRTHLVKDAGAASVAELVRVGGSGHRPQQPTSSARAPAAIACPSEWLPVHGEGSSFSLLHENR